jgi:SPASM domain peptide maturase of grasp-with-spasm system
MSDIEISKPFLLYTNCLLIDGYQRSVIVDIQMGEHYFIPTVLGSIISIFQGRTISDIESHYGKENGVIIKEYFNYLYKKKLIFFTDNTRQFPPIELSYKIPSIITNAIVNLSFSINYEIIPKLLDEISCKAVVLDCSSNVKLCQIEEVLSLYSSTGIRHIEIYIKDAINIALLKPIFYKENRLQRIIVFNAKENYHYSFENGMGREIIYTEKDYKLNSKKKVVHFSVHPTIFFESQKHHTYFNRKLYIGGRGEIKNAPECKDEFGYIHDIKTIKELKNIIAKPEFQKYWLAHKELCDVCKDCEFKHMCIDNRIPSQREDGSWYHQEECDYNPYISKWKGEEGYQNLKDLGIISDENSYHRDDDKIFTINEVLWSD